MKNGTYFITGIDTDAGKSFVTGILAKRCMAEGKKVITQKFVQTGGDDFGGKSIDIDIHRKIMNVGMLPRDLDNTTAPLIFKYPASPHLAAEMDGREVDVAVVERSRKILESEFDVVLVEGAGGLVVPLKDNYTTLDYIVESGLPIIVVTSGKLGSINHTVLTLEVALLRGVKVAAVAYNHFFDDDQKISNSTHQYIKEWIETKIPECELIDIEKINIAL
ncbi:MAG: dethiobiotin synthase [Rikenellaceae bacterium]